MAQYLTRLKDNLLGQLTILEEDSIMTKYLNKLWLKIVGVVVLVSAAV